MMKLFLGAVIVALGLGAVFAPRDSTSLPADVISESNRQSLDFTQPNLEDEPPVRQIEKPSPAPDSTLDEHNANQTVAPVYSVTATSTLLSQTKVEDGTQMLEVATSTASEPALQAADATSSQTVSNQATSSQEADKILPSVLGAQTKEICWSIINGKVFTPAASGWTANRTFATRQRRFFNLQCKTPGTDGPTRHVRQLLFR